MQLSCSKRAFRLLSVTVIFCLISVLVFHAVDFSHIHPGELVPHEHTPALTVHAEEKSLWLLLIVLAFICALAAVRSFAEGRLRASSLSLRARDFLFARERIRVPIEFRFGVNPQLE